MEETLLWLWAPLKIGMRRLFASGQSPIGKIVGGYLQVATLKSSGIVIFDHTLKVHPFVFLEIPLWPPVNSGVVDDWLNDCNPIIYYEKGPDASPETKKVAEGRDFFQVAVAKNGKKNENALAFSRERCTLKG